MKHYEKIKIGNKEIGMGCPTYVIAEIGFNHEGDIGLAERMIKEAAAAGVEAVKFQTFKAEDLVSEKAEHFNVIKDYELSSDDHKKLAFVSQENGVTFLSTPFSEECVDMLEKVNVVAYKVSSMDITNLPLLKYIASTGKPMIMSTGMATIAEIVEAVDKVKEEGNNQIVLLHCISKYPVDAKEANLRNISYFKEIFGLPVGYSDHGVENITSYVAVSLGACLIEKHFTVDKTMPGPDHKISADPQEMIQLVQGIRAIEESMGKRFNTIERPDKKEATMFRRSLHSKVDIPKGTVINARMLKCVRPQNGLAPKYYNVVISRTAKVDIPKDTPISFDVI